MVGLQDILKSGGSAGIPLQSTLAPKNVLKVNNYGYPNLPLNTLITVANRAITQNTEQQVLQNLRQLADYVATLATH